MPQESKDPPPFYQRHVFCCTNQRAPGHVRGCCQDKGAAKLRDYMKSRAKDMKLRRVRINLSGCLDRCELGPTMVVYPEGVWYTCQTEADVDEILERHLRNGERVERLMLTPGQRPPNAKPPGV
ncbi:MAG: (2Fe-2S) ferredoxin domain-containing protein [Rhodospirillales bacterium]|nr:(2Fe-2S) ferredoxin domain-containing protein [Rhodospirillales bacterium]